MVTGASRDALSLVAPGPPIRPGRRAATALHDRSGFCLDAKVLFWTGAFINMGVIVGLAFVGIRAVKAHRMEEHRSRMIVAACLVVGFIVAYAFKLHFLGREDLSLWSHAAVWTLRFHETCVLVMIVGGGTAIFMGSKLRKTRIFTCDASDPVPDPALVRRHHRAGGAGLVGAILAFVSAGFVLAGMFSRLD